MTSRQYKVIEGLLDEAEAVTTEHPLLTAKGRELQTAIRDLLIKVTAEKIRAEEREGGEPKPERSY